MLEHIDHLKFYLDQINVYFYLLDNMSVDLWSLGCVIAELFLGKPIFDGKSDLD